MVGTQCPWLCVWVWGTVVRMASLPRYPENPMAVQSLERDLYYLWSLSHLGALAANARLLKIVNVLFRLP